MKTPAPESVACPIGCRCHTMTEAQLGLYECDNVEPSFSGPNACCEYARRPLPGHDKVVGSLAAVLGQLAAFED